MDSSSQLSSSLRVLASVTIKVTFNLIIKVKKVRQVIIITRRALIRGVGIIIMD
jgi:hypothetical protein